MPRFDFVCPVCGEHREEWIDNSKNEIIKCNKCFNKMVKDFSTINVEISFRGKGFHKNDYK